MPTWSNLQRLTVRPFEPAMNCVPAQIAMLVFLKVIPSK